MVAALGGGAWHVFDSRTKQWTALGEWKPTSSDTDHNYLVFVPSLRSFFYHIDGTDALEAVPLLPLA